MAPEIIDRVEAFVKERLGDDTTGHDWWHVDRVRRTALELQREEGGDINVIELAALLHDISDHKFNGGDHGKGAETAKSFLLSIGVSNDIANHVSTIIERISFSAGKGPMDSIEGKIVQDADRLDALGAIGIARCFATSCKLGQPIYDPTNPKGKHALGHFYQKLLLLKDRMNTNAGKKRAEKRHHFLQEFVGEFQQECDM